MSGVEILSISAAICFSILMILLAYLSLNVLFATRKSVAKTTYSPFGWMWRGYFEYLCNNLTRQFWEIPESPAFNHEMDGAVVLITGASSGVGLETAKQLLTGSAPRMLIVTAINQVELESMHAELVDIVNKKAGNGNGRKTEIVPYILHLHSFQSVQAFASEIQDVSTELDVVLLNAGIVTSGWAVSEDGLETSLQVNYVSNVILALLLLPFLNKPSRCRTRSKHTARITFLASDGHMAAGLPFEYHPTKAAHHSILEHLCDRGRFNENTRYCDTKLLVLLFVREITRHTEVLVNGVHPGYMNTNLFRTNPKLSRVMNGWFMTRVFARSVSDGARCIIHAIAVAGEESRGQYLSECVATQPSAFVRSADGQRLQKKAFREVLSYLEVKRPGLLQEAGLYFVDASL
jgi:NAD(P)-dependent dehydrogenase (short-subunit alcohol dehydrogenase family)